MRSIYRYWITDLPGTLQKAVPFLYFLDSPPVPCLPACHYSHYLYDPSLYSLPYFTCHYLSTKNSLPPLEFIWLLYLPAPVLLLHALLVLCRCAYNFMPPTYYCNVDRQAWFTCYFLPLPLYNHISTEKVRRKNKKKNFLFHFPAAALLLLVLALLPSLVRRFLPGWFGFSVYISLSHYRLPLYICLSLP